MDEKPESEKSDDVQSGVIANYLESKLALIHMKPLIEFLEEYIVAKHAYLGSPQCQGITYHDLWFLLKPGDEVISPEENQAYRIFGAKIPTHKAVSPWADYERQGKITISPPPPPGEEDATYFEYELGRIDFDGYCLTPHRNLYSIPPFEGEKLVTELRYYPLRFHPALLNGAQRAHSSLKETGNLLRLQLIERGRKYTQMTSFQHAYHSGTAVGGNEALDGQVVVDITRASQERLVPPKMPKNWLRERNPSSLTDRRSFLCEAECCTGEVVWSERGTQRRRNDEFLDSFIPQNPDDPLSVSVASRFVESMRKSPEGFRFSDEELVIMGNTVEGFVLRTRKWAYMRLDNLSEIDYRSGEAKSEKEDEVKDDSKTAFDDLVLPEGHKEMILSLVAQHFRDQGKDEEVDIVRGKGKGLIMLLHGAPGVGKTSTAEGVAELFKKPLLQITCGDLGSTAKGVETALEKNFSLASRWDAILLLDEADVFLASRSRATSGTDFNRNALVAVFLRVLEYYTGILFLTTNRVGDFDEAFASRIHVSLEYPPLDRKSTKKVLALNLRLIGERFKKSKRLISIDEEDISIDAEEYWSTNDKARLNGRQIRNACHTALALAEFEAQGGNHKTILAPNAKVTLASKHFSTVFKAYLDFNKYLKDVYGTWSEDRAKEFELRAGEKVPSGSNDLQSRRNLESSQTGSFPGQRFYQ
ncbi:P-loop containing nucleoside triphosphate hydrolase protein [Corynespora cassiicola Philippines]|uniref:P-loop containing nucleoside triphosphate hydrolase protein n=1 Tax=Corynespora cassiicola Philippines TaxID=1448308 RepID=A0A2T2NB84_CORCC|nr:P-loop containing nucleoside triphosphate hydrolase protein [Corynespora cassiicola Philippines]